MEPEVDRAWAVERAGRALVEQAAHALGPQQGARLLRHGDAFRRTIEPRVSAYYERFRELGPWRLCLVYVLAASFRFVEHARALAEVAAIAHDGSGACVLCQGPRPARKCHAGGCAGGMHDACWLEWRLGEPEACPLCREKL